MSTTSAGIKKISEISPVFNQIELKTTVFDDLKSLLPVNVYFDPKYNYEMSQFSFDSIASDYTNNINVETVNGTATAVDLIRELFTVFNGFPNAQKLTQYVQAIEDLKRNPTLSDDDSIFINTFSIKIQRLTVPLSDIILSFKYIDKDGIVQVVTKIDDENVQDIAYDSEITEGITKIEQLIIKYQDTTIWMLYDTVKYMEIIDGGLKVNSKRGSLITPLDYVTAAAAKDPSALDTYTFLVSPNAMADSINGTRAAASAATPTVPSATATSATATSATSIK